MKISIKFSFSDKATKMCAIVLMDLKFTYLVNVKTIRTIAHIFVAFSEKLNFKVSKGSVSLYEKHSIHAKIILVNCFSNSLSSLKSNDNSYKHIRRIQPQSFLITILEEPSLSQILQFYFRMLARSIWYQLNQYKWHLPSFFWWWKKLPR